MFELVKDGYVFEILFVGLGVVVMFVVKYFVRKGFWII